MGIPNLSLTKSNKAVTETISKGIWPNCSWWRPSRSSALKNTKALIQMSQCWTNRWKMIQPS